MKKKRQFIKIVLACLIVIACFGVLDSFVLAHLDKNTNTEVTVALIATVLGTVIAYCIKSLGEKKSRNQHGLDENGIPYNFDNENISENVKEGE